MCSPKDFEEWMSELLDMKFEVRHDVPKIGLTTDDTNKIDNASTFRLKK